jgi:hypothetical protein
MALAAFTGEGSQGKAEPPAPNTQILDVFFGLDDALPFRANLLCRGALVAGMDAW